MRTFVAAGMAVCAVLVASGVAHAAPVAPQLGDGCAEDLSGAMTLLADGQTYAICQEVVSSAVWAAVPVPFDPSDTWFSYGPTITLHGQGMRNPNLRSGPWRATPRDPETTCRAEQQTVIEAGTLSSPRVSEGGVGTPLDVEMLPKLFYAELSGNCLWNRV